MVIPDGELSSTVRIGGTHLSNDYHRWMVGWISTAGRSLPVCCLTPVVGVSVQCQLKQENYPI